jgi:hypothetical protein
MLNKKKNKNKTLINLGKKTNLTEINKKRPRLTMLATKPMDNNNNTTKIKIFKSDQIKSVSNNKDSCGKVANPVAKKMLPSPKKKSLNT